MEKVIVPGVVMTILFIGLPWLILHYVTKWKANSSLTAEDEGLLDELYELSRRLDDRMTTIERIIQADSPHWSPMTEERAPIRPRLDQPSADLSSSFARSNVPGETPAGRA